MMQKELNYSSQVCGSNYSESSFILDKDKDKDLYQKLKDTPY